MSRFILAITFSLLCLAGSTFAATPADAAGPRNVPPPSNTGLGNVGNAWGSVNRPPGLPRATGFTRNGIPSGLTQNNVNRTRNAPPWNPTR